MRHHGNSKPKQKMTKMKFKMSEIIKKRHFESHSGQCHNPPTSVSDLMWDGVLMRPPPSLVQFLKDFGGKRSKAGRGESNYGAHMECTCHPRQRFISYHPPLPQMGMISPRPRPVLRCHPKCHLAGSGMHEHSWRECCDRAERGGGGGGTC